MRSFRDKKDNIIQIGLNCEILGLNFFYHHVLYVRFEMLNVWGCHSVHACLLKWH